MATKKTPPVEGFTLLFEDKESQITTHALEVEAFGLVLLVTTPKGVTSTFVHAARIHEEKDGEGNVTSRSLTAI